MKDMIVLLASILLGLFIFGLIAGDEGSIKAAIKESWVKEAAGRQYVVLTDAR